MASRDCLSVLDDESADLVERTKAGIRAPKKADSKKTVPKKRASEPLVTTSKKRRDEPLTIDDLPVIVKAVVEALPGTSFRRSTSSTEKDGGSSSRVEEGKNKIIIVYTSIIRLCNMIGLTLIGHVSVEKIAV